MAWGGVEHTEAEKAARVQVCERVVCTPLWTWAQSDGCQCP